MKPIRDLSTSDNEAFWSAARASAERVKEWPDWKRAGINIATERPDPSTASETADHGEAKVEQR
jgi:hypothetical protein